MLLLTRKIGESIIIGDDIVVTVASVQDKFGRLQVRLGIAAPPNVGVWREELYIERERPPLELQHQQTELTSTHEQGILAMKF